MMITHRIQDEYFEWLCNMVCRGSDREKSISFDRLLSYLHAVEFTYSIDRDANCIGYAMSLRYRFTQDCGYDECIADYIETPCSVFEVMVSLAIKCEEIMDDTQYGDRTKQWFWRMVSSLGLGGMYGYNFNERLAEDVMITFLNREYAPDGHGGLFTIIRCPTDLRYVDIWTQMMWYLNTVTID